MRNFSYEWTKSLASFRLNNWNFTLNDFLLLTYFTLYSCLNCQFLYLIIEQQCVIKLDTTLYEILTRIACDTKWMDRLCSSNAHPSKWCNNVYLLHNRFQLGLKWFFRFARSSFLLSVSLSSIWNNIYFTMSFDEKAKIGLYYQSINCDNDEAEKISKQLISRVESFFRSCQVSIAKVFI